MSFKHMSVVELKERLADETLVLLDVRDQASFQAGHIEGAQQLNNDTVGEIVAQADKALPLVVVCYHGHSSQDAAAFLVTQGFTDVYSLDGGYAAWAMSA